MAEEDAVEVALGKTITTTDYLISSIGAVVGGLVGGILGVIGLILGIVVMVAGYFFGKKKSTKILLMVTGGAMIGAGLSSSMTRLAYQNGYSGLWGLFDPSIGITEKLSRVSGISLAGVPSVPTITVGAPTLTGGEYYEI